MRLNLAPMGIDPGQAAIGLVFAAAPMISIFPVIGQRFGCERRAATALILATIVSVATMAGVIHLVR